MCARTAPPARSSPTTDSLRAPALGRVDVEAELKDYKGQTQVAAGEAFDSSTENLGKRTEFSKIGGMQLGLLPKKSRGGKVVVRISLRFGDEKSLFNRDIAGDMAGSMLSHGTTRLTREQLSAEFEKLGTTWNVDGSAEGANLMIETTRQNYLAALKLGLEVLKTPRFDANEFAQLKNSTIEGVEAQKDEPDTKLSEAVALLGNPYPRGDVRHPDTSAENHR